MSKHTPKPWKAAKSDSGNNLVVDRNGRIIAEMRIKTTKINYSEHSANTDLVAAAPDLLEACQAVQHWGLKGKMPDGRWAFDLLAPAIAKATVSPMA